jgi:RNA 3'-terminal phosphate cyclase (ATP)
LTSIEGIAAVTNLPAHIPQRIANRANNLLKGAGLPAVVQPVRTGGHSTGAGLFMMAAYEGITAGFSGLGKKGKPSEQVASEAADALIAYHQQDRPLDPHLPDQIIPVLAWAEGESVLSTQRITRHTLTNIRTIGAFIERDIVVEGEEGQPGTIRIKDKEKR